MDRVYQSNVSDTATPLPSPGSNGFVQSDVPFNLQSSTSPTTPGPQWYYHITESILAVISAAGMTFDANNLHQLADAIVALRDMPRGGVLDALSARPAMAFSTRLLLTAYAGACMRVRRDSDNIEQDIGFSSGSLDTTSLLAFVGSASGFVSKWYDQSGNGFDATQSVTSLQPMIVDAGVTVTIAGFVAPYFNQVSLVFDNTAGAQADFTLSSVFSTTQNNTYTDTSEGFCMSGFFYADESTAAHDFGFGNLGDKLTFWGGSGTGWGGAEIGVQGPTTINDGGVHVGLVLRTSDTGQADIYLDGALNVSGAGPTGARIDSIACRIGSQGLDGAPVLGSPVPTVFYTPEAIVYASRLSDPDLALLKSAQALYYGGA